MPLIKSAAFHYIQTASMGYVSIVVLNQAFGDAIIHIPIILDACSLYYSNSSIITTAQKSADYLFKFYKITKSHPNKSLKDMHQEVIQNILSECF